MRRCFWICLGVGLALALAALALKAWRPGEIGRVTLTAGESVEIGSDVLLLKDFRVLRYPSGKIRQFESEVHVIDPDAARSTAATISVNHPLRWKDRWIYQMSYDAETERATVLEVRRDPWLSLAGIAGVLLVLGAFFGDLAFRGSWPRSVAGTAHRWPRLLMAAALTLLPLFIIGRAVLRPEPIPALQSHLMAPHVAAYAVSYLIMIFAAFGWWRRLMPLGFFLMTLGLVLGAVWGKLCWGDFWQYDPKEMWSFATWLCYLGYFAFNRHPRAERLLRWLGAALIILTLTWVNYSRICIGLHSYA